MPEKAPARSRVLVVEDEEDIRGLIGSILESTSVPHEAVGDGNEALDRLSSVEYEAVVLDLMMPGTDGLAVIGTLAVARPELLPRIIVLTGGSDELVARVDQKVFRILRKPFAPRDLVAAVRECLEQNAPAEKSAADVPVSPASEQPHIRLANQGGFIIDLPGVERWWVEGDVEPFRSEGRSLRGHEPSDGAARASSVPLSRATESIRGMLLELESLGMAVRI